MRRFRLLLTLLCLGTWASGQVRSSIDSLAIVPDSLVAFTLDDYYAAILKYHPIARQAGLLSEVARQEIRLARGAFDPKIEAGLHTKKYNGTEYYSLAGGSLKFPTASLVNPFVGLDRNTGAYLSPEDYLGSEYNYRQLHAGVSMTLGRGMFTDERRAALKQANLFQEMTEAEQIKIINKLLLDAAKDYWEWYFAYNNYRLLSRGVRIASAIYHRVKIDNRFGEAAAIDTVQAKITWQQRLLEQQEAFLNFQNSGIAISNALWDSLGRAVMPAENWVPVLQPDPALLTEAELAALTEQALTSHPDLRKVDVKLRQLEVEKRLAAENLKPQLDLNYYALNQPLNPDFETNFSPANNYKLGVDFSMPLLLRKERSKLALTKLKLTHTRFEQDMLTRTVQNELTTTYNKLVTLYTLIGTQRNMVQNYEQLLQAELLNLREGESDLFKINIQQEKLIEAQTKWLKLTADFEKQLAYLYWAAGGQRVN